MGWVYRLPPGLGPKDEPAAASQEENDAQVHQFLKDANLLKYGDILADNEIDFETLFELDQSDLVSRALLTCCFLLCRFVTFRATPWWRLSSGM